MSEFIARAMSTRPGGGTDPYTAKLAREEREARQADCLHVRPRYGGRCCSKCGKDLGAVKLRPGIEQVKVRDLRVGDVLSPTERIVTVVPLVRGRKASLCIAEKHAACGHRVEWGADTRVTIKARRRGR